jgi:dolichol-phosphate mannosyltransferase
VFEFLIGLYDKWLGRIIPTRFALFGTVGRWAWWYNSPCSG